MLRLTVVFIFALFSRTFTNNVDINKQNNVKNAQHSVHEVNSESKGATEKASDTSTQHSSVHHSNDKPGISVNLVGEKVTDSNQFDLEKNSQPVSKQESGSIGEKRQQQPIHNVNGHVSEQSTLSSSSHQHSEHHVETSKSLNNANIKSSQPVRKQVSSSVQKPQVPDPYSFPIVYYDDRGHVVDRDIIVNMNFPDPFNFDTLDKTIVDRVIRKRIDAQNLITSVILRPEADGRVRMHVYRQKRLDSGEVSVNFEEHVENHPELVLNRNDINENEKKVLDDQMARPALREEGVHQEVPVNIETELNTEATDAESPEPGVSKEPTLEMTEEEKQGNCNIHHYSLNYL